MGAGSGGTKWAKIHARANNKLCALGWGGTKWAKIHASANNKLWAPVWGVPNGLKCARGAEFSQFAHAQCVNVSPFGAPHAWRPERPLPLPPLATPLYLPVVKLNFPK